MELEVDRMENLQFKDADFQKEIRVVMEERRWRTDDQPNALVDEALAGNGIQCPSLSLAWSLAG